VERRASCTQAAELAVVPPRFFADLFRLLSLRVVAEVPVVGTALALRAAVVARFLEVSEAP
jgi:hypothetical protein